MRVATYNVSSIKSRLPRLLEWLERERPDVVCLQELKVFDAGFPEEPLLQAGYRSLWKGQRSWNGVAILSRGDSPLKVRRELPGDPQDDHSRYLEAAIDGVVVACLYLPNGNPQPGPKFDYKLAWFDRLIAHAAALWRCGHPVVLAGTSMW
jgi:exodeoxyribonuclease-3